MQQQHSTMIVQQATSAWNELVDAGKMSQGTADEEAAEWEKVNIYGHFAFIRDFSQKKKLFVQ